MEFEFQMKVRQLSRQLEEGFHPKKECGLKGDINAQRVAQMHYECK